MKLVKLPQWITVMIEIICLMILISFQFARNKYRDHDDSSRNSWLALRVLAVVSISDNLLCFLITGDEYNYPFIAAMIRPLYLIASIRIMREYVERYLQVIQDSFPMVLFTLVYMLYFAWMGQRIFSGTLEGVQYYNSFGDSFFNMLVLLTTSNYPDIMLPAY
jgi:nicotinamide riboside transporter PnuC